MTRNAFSTTTKGMCPKMCKNRLVSPRKQPFPSYKSSNSRHTFLARTSKKLFPSLRKLYHQERAQQNLHRLNAESFPPAKRTNRRKRTFSKACQNLIPANSALCSFSSQDTSLNSLPKHLQPILPDHIPKLQLFLDPLVSDKLLESTQQAKCDHLLPACSLSGTLLSIREVINGLMYESVIPSVCCLV